LQVLWNRRIRLGFGHVENVVLNQILLNSLVIGPYSKLFLMYSGPLLKKIGYSEESVAQRIDDWLALGVKLSRQLGFDEFGLSQSEKVRIYHYYVPVFLWCKRELELHTAKFNEGEEVPALVVINP